jgi:hypothetical protein
VPRLNRAAPFPKRLLATGSAAALGTWGPAVAVWPPTYVHRSGAIGLVVAGLLLAGALRVRSVGIVAQGVAVAVAVGVGAALTIPRVGRAPVLVAWLLVILGYEALVAAHAWEPPADGWPALPALPVLGVAGFVWAQTQSLPVVGALAIVGFSVVEACRRSPAWPARADRAVRRVPHAIGGRVCPSVRRIVAAARRLAARAWTRVRPPWSRRDRWLVAAMATGFAVRLAWAVVMTDGQLDFYSRWNVVFARQFAHGQTPSYAGIHTAYWPPGYAATLAPLQWVSDHTGWFGFAGAASALNLVVGCSTILLVAALAGRWFGGAARNPAAWFMALAPSHIYATSAAVGETLATTVFVGAVLAATVVVDRRPPEGRVAGWRPHAPFVAVGLLVGYAALVKDFGVVLVLVPALCVRARRGTWRGAWRPTVATAVGALLLLGPWGVRNAVQVGVPSPFSTVTSEGLCYTKYRPDALKVEGEGPTSTLTPELLRDCYRNSPFDNPKAPNPYLSVVKGGAFTFTHPDEARWNRRLQGEFVSWAARNPGYLARVAPLRIYTTAGNDDQGGFVLAEHSGEIMLVGPLARRVYVNAADAWYYLVLGLTLLGLALIPRVRRAIPLWALALVLVVYTIPGPRSLSRHFFIAYPFLVAMASAAVAAIAHAAPSASGGAFQAEDGARGTDVGSD